MKRALLSCVAIASLAACGSNPARSSSGDTGGAKSTTVTGSGATVGAMSATSGVGQGGGTASRCTIQGPAITCQHETLTLDDSMSMRSVLYETPLGTPPSAGWPAVVFFQGSFVAGHTSFSAMKTDSFGRFNLTATIKALLDHGYAVVAPDAASNGSLYWATNIPPSSFSWAGCSDDVLMKHLFAAVSSGAFGAVDAGRLYAMGISSGGFMTSRMAVSYPGRFRALADHSGSYATCSATCSVPTPLPSDHPPTLFLHGDLDMVVPMSAVTPYFDALTSEGHETKLVTDPNAGHEWLAAAPTAIVAWFDSHP